MSGKQLVFLFIVTTTVIVVVFLCGVKVGRGAREAQGDEPEPSALSATASPDQQPVPQTVEPRPTEPPPPAAEAPDKLTYSEVLKGKATDVPLKPEADVKAGTRTRTRSGGTAARSRGACTCTPLPADATRTPLASPPLAVPAHGPSR